MPTIFRISLEQLRACHDHITYRIIQPFWVASPSSTAITYQNSTGVIHPYLYVLHIRQPNIPSSRVQLNLINHKILVQVATGQPQGWKCSPNWHERRTTAFKSYPCTSTAIPTISKGFLFPFSISCSAENMSVPSFFVRERNAIPHSLCLVQKSRHHSVALAQICSFLFFPAFFFSRHCPENGHWLLVPTTFKEENYYSVSVLRSDTQVNQKSPMAFGWGSLFPWANCQIVPSTWFATRPGKITLKVDTRIKTGRKCSRSPGHHPLPWDFFQFYENHTHKHTGKNRIIDTRAFPHDDTYCNSN